MIFLQLQVINTNYRTRTVARFLSLIFVALLIVHLGVLSWLQAAIWLGLCAVVEAYLIWELHNLMARHADEVDLAAPVELGQVKLFTAVLCWLAAVPAFFTPLHPMPAPVVGVLISVAGLISIASQRDMRRWAFFTNAPAHALALIVNLYALSSPDNRAIFLLVGVVFIANTFTGSVTTSRALTGLVESRMEAARANLAKSMFVARMGHEIRTPLNGVLGIADLMAMEGVPETQRGHLDLIRQSGRALLSLLNDLLDFSKIEAGKLTLTPTPQNLRLALEPACAAFRIVAEEKGLQFQSDLAAVDAWFDVDGPRVGQIVQNLLANAVNFTDAGSVSLTASRYADRIALAVTDTGPGLSDGEIQKLFREFSQIEHNGHLKTGTGLGLIICSELARLMGGEVSCVSTKGEGSTFTLSLPLAPCPALAANPSNLPRVPAGRGDARRGDGESSPIRVLVAEDHPTNQLVISGLLKLAGVAFRIEADGAKAVEAWKGGGWDLVLMDVQMPGMDGLEATRAIRILEQTEGRTRTPIFGFSADAMSHQVAEQLEAGLDGHLQKPIQVEALFSLLEVIERRVPDVRPICSPTP